MKKYQLIKPFIGDKIYETTLNKGAKKCYNDVKQRKIPNLTSFDIKEINTGKIYTYKIHHPYIPQIGGGEIKNEEEHQDHKQEQLNDLKQDKLNEVLVNIKEMNIEIKKIETKIDTTLNKLNECYQNNVCTFV